ncbi:MAG: hypothetical protein AVDCRST_MAG77-5827, partial [uncultured Chloroflexi bacterium]
TSGTGCRRSTSSVRPGFPTGPPTSWALSSTIRCTLWPRCLQRNPYLLWRLLAPLG